eukprot:gb/GECG01014612.1/.p1 GENE.gb/GECG01014612.1/~~gb/GECG01014612.1/.p1  ORF type:complete len:219 (+),score=8.47 gb/GECG01014612.1/:1-657(+)
MTTRMLCARHSSPFPTGMMRRWITIVSLIVALVYMRHHMRSLCVTGDFVVNFWGKDFAHNCFYDTRCLINNSTRWQPTSRAWRWQKCTELAYFQVAPQQNSLRPQAVDFEYHIDQCKSIFNFDSYGGPATQAINDRFGGAEPNTKNASNIFYSNGSDDPWKMASVRDNLSSTLIEYTAVCDGCGHSRDLSAPSASDPHAIVQQRVFLADTFQRWLPDK